MVPLKSYYKCVFHKRVSIEFFDIFTLSVLLHANMSNDLFVFKN
jgi:hypothetical protein